MKYFILFLICAAAALFIIASVNNKQGRPINNPTVSPTVSIPTGASSEAQQNTGMANPASTYCIEQGGKNEIVTAADGSQSGRCMFADGRICDEWEFFRTKNCK